MEGAWQKRAWRSTSVWWPKAGELPLGLLFLPYGDASSRLMTGDTHGTGMPSIKGIDVELERERDAPNAGGIHAKPCSASATFATGEGPRPPPIAHLGAWHGPADWTARTHSEKLFLMDVRQSAQAFRRVDAARVVSKQRFRNRVNLSRQGMNGMDRPMIDENELAENLIPGGLKKSASYHSHLGKLTFREIKRRMKANRKDPERTKLQQMKKLILEQSRLLRRKRGRKQ
jgi:hypothetical protein